MWLQLYSVRQEYTWKRREQRRPSDFSSSPAMNRISVRETVNTCIIAHLHLVLLALCIFIELAIRFFYLFIYFLSCHVLLVVECNTIDRPERIQCISKFCGLKKAQTFLKMILADFVFFITGLFLLQQMRRYLMFVGNKTVLDKGSVLISRAIFMHKHDF